MKKLQAARDYLLTSPLGIEGDQLLTFAEEGSVTRHRGDGPPSFSIAYTAHLIVTDFAGAPADLLFVASEWVALAVPNAPPDALKFVVDILDHRKADVSLKIDLVDVVKATATEAGTALDGQPDADALAFDMATLAPGLPEA